MHHARRRLLIALKLLASLILATLIVSAVYATTNTLPGGTEISITIDTINGQPSLAEIVLPPNETSVDLVIEGLAETGFDPTITDTTVISVLDISWSTTFSAHIALPDVSCFDWVYPSQPNQIIDCEIEGAVQLNEYIVNHYKAVDEVGVIVFAHGAATADVTPDGGDDPFIRPETDSQPNGVRDLYEVLLSIQIPEPDFDDLDAPGPKITLFTEKTLIHGTNYASAITRTIETANQSSHENVYVAFVSDGWATRGISVTEILPDLLPPDKALIIYTFAITGIDLPFPVEEELRCDSSPADPDNPDYPHGFGSLQDIADITGGECTEIPDVSQLGEILPAKLFSSLDAIKAEVDGVIMPDGAVVGAGLPLPQPGGVEVEYTANVSLGLGTHTICMIAEGSDTQGDGNVKACRDITVRHEWEHTCDADNGLQVDIIGAGMGQWHTVVHNPQWLTINQPEQVAFVRAQATLKAYPSDPPPTQVIITSDTEQHILSEPIDPGGSYFYEATFQPTTHITAEVVGVGNPDRRTPRALVAYVFRQGDSTQAHSGQIIHNNINREIQTTTLIFPPLEMMTDLSVTAVVIEDYDDDDDGGVDEDPFVVEATAGGITTSITNLSFTDEEGLSIVELILTDVPTGTSEVVITLYPPLDTGDLGALVGVNVGYACPGP